MSKLFALPRAPTRRNNARVIAANETPPGLDEALSDRRFRPLPASLEARYQSETAQDQMRALFRAALGTAVAYSVQLLVEGSLTPDALGLSAALHFGVVVPLLLLIAAFSREARSPWSRDLLSAAIPMLIVAQATVTYFESTAEGSLYYLTLLAVIPILANASLPLTSRAALWTTALCLTLLAIVARVPHSAPAHLNGGALAPVSLCALMTLYSAIQRNRDTRRVYLLDLRHRLHAAEVGAEARHDPLTGLANRRRLEEVAVKVWDNPREHVSPISVVLFDVDRFKAYNDLYGHQAGDECLRKVAATTLAEVGGGDDVAARYGGEEFILLLPRTPLDEARRVAERLRAAVAALRITHAGGEELGVVTASFGVACADSDACDFASLTAEADAALYNAKRSGRNRVLAAAIGGTKAA